MAANRPDLNELLAALEGFLGDGARRSDGSVDFKMLVAQKTLGIIRRELASEVQRSAELQRLQALLRTPEETDPDALNSRLALAIRSGEIDLDDADLIEHLLRSAVDQLSIDNPGYSALRQRLGQTPKS
ncbi:MAG: hypothetical protein ISN29_06705 [Gammaproteobacteria bacterium AqS3]|nr:hypothetical protein [Gammaproteobacteria bacterium AqS3]